MSQLALAGLLAIVLEAALLLVLVLIDARGWPTPGYRSWLGGGLVLWAVASVLSTIWIGLPAKLPDVALGSPMVLHSERGVAVFVAGLIGLIVVSQGFRGRLPTEVSDKGLKYPEEAGLTAKELAQALADERRARELLAERVKKLEPPPAGGEG